MTPKLPEWVHKRDGRREPFDADRISQSIYAATEAVGLPNAFLARELTDGVLHFLGQENEAQTIATGQIAEVVEKVVRELGQPELAQAIRQESSPSAHTFAHEPAAIGECTFAYAANEDPENAKDRFWESVSLHSVFARDLAAAQESGLIELLGRHSPRHLHTLVLGPPRQQTMPAWKTAWTDVRDASRLAECLVVDSAERYSALYGNDWFDAFLAAIDAYLMLAIANLNVPTPPVWADPVESGPLFAPATSSDEPNLTEATAAILDTVSTAAEPYCWIDWHVQHRDLVEPERNAGLNRLLPRPATLERVRFTMHRPRMPVGLASGLDRRYPAVSLRVRLPLEKFLNRPGIDGDGVKMIAKLPSLVRMAVSAGVQKRNYLRLHNSELASGFLLERARLIIEPMNVDDVVAAVTGAHPLKTRIALEFGQRLLETIRDAAVQAARSAGLEIAVAVRDGLTVAPALLEHDELGAIWQAAGALFRSIDGGVVNVPCFTGSADEIWGHLRHAWRAAGVAHVQFFRCAKPVPT